jgi:hypothetical protein
MSTISAKAIWTRIEHLFIPMFRVLTEEQFNARDYEPHRIEYDEAAVLCDDPLYCDCNPTVALPTRGEATLLYGGRGVSCKRFATCPNCGEIEDEFRLRDGYIMKRDDTGRWLIFVHEAPLIRQWWESLVPGG